MKAEIVSIGTELLLGNITDTNASWLAQRLPDLGIDVYFISQVGDNLERIVGLLRLAWSRSDLIITTGGLGPTQDDLTRESIAGLLGEELYIDEEQERLLRARFARGLGAMPESNVRQARLIPSTTPIINPFGTAPGWWTEKDGHRIVSMPGVPREMYRMWENEVSPRLMRLAGDSVIVSRTFKTMGMSEAGMDELIARWLPSTNPTVGVYAKQDGIWIRLTAKAPDRSEAQSLLLGMEQEMRPVIERYIWGFDEDTLESVVGQMLAERNLTLSVMESCTGGLLANTITDVAGSSRYFMGGIVSYSNDVKALSGVDRDIIETYGVVSQEVAQAMALAIRERLGTDYGIGITGVAGPDELEGRPVGTVFACATDGRWQRAYQGTAPQARLDFKNRATRAALLELRRLLLGEGEPVSPSP
jgi:nicotinamide-nucleotide amidase